MSDPNSSTNMHGKIRFLDVLMIGGGMAVLLLVIYLAIRQFCAKLRRVAQQNERRRKLVVHEKIIIEDLPRFVYDGGCDGRGGQLQKVPDCSVCLGEVVVGEEVRVLPNCSHMFHVDCIDQWLYSHSTCPVCRVVIVAPPHSVDVVVE